MKQIAASGEIGRVLTIYGRGKCDHRGGGEDLIVLGTHILDLQSFFFGEPISVLAEVFADGRPIAGSDRAETVEPIGLAAGDDIFATFHFPDGVRGISESRRGLLAESEGHVYMGITVQGTKGAVSLRFVFRWRTGFTRFTRTVTCIRLKTRYHPNSSGERSFSHYSTPAADRRFSSCGRSIFADEFFLSVTNALVSTTGGYSLWRF